MHKLYQDHMKYVFKQLKDIHTSVHFDYVNLHFQLLCIYE